MGASTGSETATAIVVGKEYKVVDGHTVFGHYSHMRGYQPIRDKFKLILVCVSVRDVITFNLRSPDSREPLAFLGEQVYFDVELDQTEYLEELKFQ